MHIQNLAKTNAWILPKVNTQLFNWVLADFAQEYGVGEHKRILLAIDQGGYTSNDLSLPERIDLIIYLLLSFLCNP
ncbi:MAG: hypothetical protein RMX97_05730 [Nostoc sp. DedQUE11]|nr:hypothetical protein [Nostoc sp. DedQUE11]